MKMKRMKGSGRVLGLDEDKPMLFQYTGKFCASHSDGPPCLYSALDAENFSIKPIKPVGWICAWKALIRLGASRGCRVSSQWVTWILGDSSCLILLIQ